MHKQLFSPANHYDCHKPTPFVYENGMSVFFISASAHTDDTNTHTLPMLPLLQEGC